MVAMCGQSVWYRNGLFGDLIICVALDLAVYLEKSVSGFSRYHKYSLGADLRRIARQNISLIVRANSETDRLATLLLLRNSLE